MPALPQLSTPRAAPWGLQALGCGYAPDAHAQPLRCWPHSRAAEGAWGAHPGLVLPLRCASHTQARSAAADAQETGAVSDDRAQTQAWPRTEPTQDRLQSSPVLAAAAPPADSSAYAVHARTVSNGTQGQEGAPSRRSGTGEGAAGAGSRGAFGAQSSSAAAGASAEVPREGARSSISGHGEEEAQPTSRLRGPDHAEASTAIAGGPRSPHGAGAGGSEGEPAGPLRRAGEQEKKKSDAERAEEDAAGLAWLARLGGRWGTDMPSTVAGWRARALSYMRESFLIGYTTVVRCRAHAVKVKCRDHPC